MMSRRPFPLALCFIGSMLIAACSDDRAIPVAPGHDSETTLTAAAGGNTFLVIGKSNKLPTNFTAKISAVGGDVVYTVPEIGIALVRSDAADFASRAAGISGLQSVTADIVVQMAPDDSEAPEVTDEGGPPGTAELADPPHTNDDDRFFDLQWAMDALDWTDAVEISSVRGQGVRVAVLDSGILSTHNEFQANLNTALSTSFVPGELFDRPAGFHGTHVSGIVAAANNGLGTIGVAPEVELVSVKVLAGATASGSYAGIAAGLVYAGNIDADVANMSIGATLDRDGTVYNAACAVVAQVTAEDVTATINALKRAVQYATLRGVTLIASAGNCGTDGDTDKNRFHLPSDIPDVLSIAATGPEGWGLDPDTNLDRHASYSNYGRSVIDFAAPGGDATLPGNALCTILTGPSNIPLTQFCWVLDLVMSASNSSPFGYAWTAGTSMAAPAATGVAALIISKNGGEMLPDDVEAALGSAVNFDDGGVFGSGNTKFFGGGHLSALEALR